ncbi:MAG: class I SAM-dependent methyltransferase [Xanthobacteraceae bacterium]
MNLATSLQPDQQPARWDDHVAAYEAVFEPLSLAFARRALDLLGIRPGDRLIDVGAGCGGAALAAANRGAQVLAVDASSRMVARMRARANGTNGGAGRIWAVAMDGTALAVPNASFDAALSVFGVILFPDAVRGMREIVRVLKPGGRVAVVSWTETERYELAARLIAAITEVRGPQPPPSVLPAQLRFREEPVFRSLFAQAGLTVHEIVRLEQRWPLPSARWIAEHIAFAPGMAAMVQGLGADRTRVLDAFVVALVRDQGRGEAFGNRPFRACDKARMVKKSVRGA